MNRSRWSESLREHARVLAETETACLDALEQLTEKTVESLARGGKILLFGNGGSAADAQHLAAEFVSRLFEDRPPMRAVGRARFSASAV